MRYTVSIKENRLFRRLYSSGKCAADPFLAVYCQKSRAQKKKTPSVPAEKRNRLGLTVGVKVGKAVVRNRVRRRLRESYRLSETRLQTGWDIVIVARARAAEADYKTLSHSMHRLFTKLRLWQDDSCMKPAAEPKKDPPAEPEGSAEASP